MSEEVKVWKSSDGRLHLTEDACRDAERMALLDRYEKQSPHVVSSTYDSYLLKQGLVENWNAFLREALGLNDPLKPPDKRK